jgi:GNAT superfamily N-acetyltransferase
MGPVADLQIRTMRRDELAFAVDLAAREGWNPGLHDAACFFAADPNGFLIGERHGEPVGCISAVSYAGCHGFVGLYIVRPEFRGQGHGLQLWNAALARLRGHNVGLDGVVAQQGNYAKSGFRFAYPSVRYRGRAAQAPIHASIRWATEIAFEAIAEYDRHIFPERRDAFLRQWLTQPMARAFVALDQGEVAGYAVVRRCRDGWKIGPLAGDGPAVARRLYDAAVAHAPPGEAVCVDIPEGNPDTKGFLATLDVQPVFETARMYTGPQPAIELRKLFGVTTFELG